MGIRSIGTGFDAVYIEGTDEALERLDGLMNELARLKKREGYRYGTMTLGELADSIELDASEWDKIMDRNEE